MVVEMSLPTIGTVVVTALIDSINPCAIGVLILLVSLIISTQHHDKKKLLTYGLTYIGAVFAVYLAAGLGLIVFFTRIPLWVAEYISIGVGSIIVLAGLIEIKDFFWYGEGFSLAIPPERAKQIHKMAKNLSLPGVIILGAFVAAVELPCTGAPYLAILLVLSQNFNLAALALLVLYNLLFVMPLLVILLAVYFGMTRVQDVKLWKQTQRANMRLAMGVLLVFLGWLLILLANGTINIG